jgi:hypothetical protein
MTFVGRDEDKSYAGPVSNDLAAIPFRRHIGSTDALRAGTYSKTLTFTLSTTTPWIHGGTGSPR